MTGDISLIVVPALSFIFLRYIPYPPPVLLCLTSGLLTAGHASPWVWLMAGTGERLEEGERLRIKGISLPLHLP